MVDAQFWPFLIAITLLSMSPGVDTLLVIRNTARGGIRDGVLTSLAICCGLFVHATISALGISLILLQSAWAFSALKMAGAAYLIWLGINGLLAARRGNGLPLGAVQGERQAVPLWRPLREGLLSNVLNPKTVVFYMAFLPQFIAPTDPALLKSLWLAGVHFVIANVWQIAIVFMVGSAGRWLGSRLFARALNGATGAVLILFGVRLALERQPA
ncbi:LysE family translocator [Billgrantia desiderata]|uniref:LysE family translocator n=1 Tax=Billgrantia desiderata TaxID=52021 RepID=A0AAW4YUE7_9GAMM|nr:LysE family translocator [Halomonas desiderata]MCE8013582.1 LysE family translocator [Halomonas desiderata]MCE8030730.1 LysE family translocator [Halomonas desiderata]MCE8041292.1 LysE family translocator [Halomonas desiderata]MCE8045867.1 LysE family translocator [Halomonas desiderata]MCE8051505.1 LysE family translocator [Halomonas desiderata]